MNQLTLTERQPLPRPPPHLPPLILFNFIPHVDNHLPQCHHPPPLATPPKTKTPHVSKPMAHPRRLGHCRPRVLCGELHESEQQAGRGLCAAELEVAVGVARWEFGGDLFGGVCGCGVVVAACELDVLYSLCVMTYSSLSADALSLCFSCWGYS